MRDVTTVNEISTVFADDASARSAAEALIAAGVPATAIEVRAREPGAGLAHEGPFIWRLVVVIVLWSVLGGAVGAVFGLVLAATIGPEGTAGLVFQVVCWALIGHLVVGMIAGYWVLADRSHPEMQLDRGGVVLTVRGVGDDMAAAVRAALVAQPAGKAGDVGPADDDARGAVPPGAVP